MQSLPLYILAAFTLIITPGPDFIYVLTRGIADGKRCGVISASGVASGILVHTTTAALGVAVLLRTSEVAFWALKIVGGVYLVILGYHMIKTKSAAFVVTGSDSRYASTRCFWQGFLSNVLNPKVALFFMVFLPQFVSENSAHQTLNLIALGLIYAAMTIAFLVLLGLFAGGIGSWLRTREQIASRIRLGTGSILMLLGLRLLVPERS